MQRTSRLDQNQALTATIWTPHVTTLTLLGEKTYHPTKLALVRAASWSCWQSARDTSSWQVRNWNDGKAAARLFELPRITTWPGGAWVGSVHFCKVGFGLVYWFYIWITTAIHVAATIKNNNITSWRSHSQLCRANAYIPRPVCIA